MALKLKDSDENQVNNHNNVRNNMNLDDLDNQAHSSNLDDEFFTISRDEITDDSYEEKEISFARPDDNPPELDLQDDSGDILFKIIGTVFVLAAIIGSVSGMLLGIGLLSSDSTKTKISNYETANVTVTEVGDVYMQSKREGSKKKNNLAIRTTWYQPLVVQTKETNHKYRSYIIDAKIKEQYDHIGNAYMTADDLGYKTFDAPPKYRVGDKFEAYVLKAEVKVIDDNIGYIKADVDSYAESENIANGYLKSLTLFCVIIAVICFSAMKVLDRPEK